MSIYQKPLKEVSVADLEALRNGQVRENHIVDYKALWSLGDEKRKRDFLVDVSAFANASGGDLVYGIKEDDGFPSSIIGLENFEADKATLSAEQVLGTGLDPKLTGVRFHSLSLANGKAVFIVRVPPSPDKPHMIRLGAAQFYTRHSGLNQTMDARQVRAAILNADENGKRFETFRSARLKACSQPAHTPKLHYARSIVVHVMPEIDWAGFSTPAILEKALHRFRPMGQLLSMGQQANQDGVITFETVKDETVSGYVQIFRNGAIESATYLQAGGSNNEILPGFPIMVRASLREYLTGLQEIRQQGPWTLGVILSDVAGFTLATPGFEFLRSRPVRIGEKNLVAPEQRVNDLGELDGALKAIFDYVWNACGLVTCPRFDASGNWRPNQNE